MAFNKGEYDKQYAKDHIKRKFIPFNDTVPEDQEILEWLATKPNVTQYVKALILADIECAHCEVRKYCDQCGVDGLS